MPTLEEIDAQLTGPGAPFEAAKLLVLLSALAALLLVFGVSYFFWRKIDTAEFKAWLGEKQKILISPEHF